MENKLLSLHPYEIALKFITWRARIESGTIELWPQNTSFFKTFHKRFAKYLSDLNYNFTEDDINWAAQNFLEKHSCLWDWYIVLLKGANIKVIFFDEQPWIEQTNQISHSGFEKWRKISSRIGPDILIALALVSQNQDIQDAACLSKWPTIVLPWNKDLVNLYKKELADTHIHLTACDPVSWLWDRLMKEQARVGKLLYIEPALKHGIRRAREIRKILFQDFLNSSISFFKDKNGKWYVNSHEYMNSKNIEIKSGTPLFEERLFLVWAWKKVREKNNFISHKFDYYLSIKSDFFFHARQARGTRPGLMQFKHYFNRSKGVPSFSPKSERQGLGRRFCHLLESPNLKYIELRISPFQNIKDYIQYFKNIKIIEDRLFPRWYCQQNSTNHEKLFCYQEKTKSQNYNPKPLVRFIIHFIREEGQGSVKYKLAFERLRRLIARQSAILHYFRRNYPELAQYISGVDVANMERNCSPEIFTPYLRLLRGQYKIDNDLSEEILLENTAQRLLGPWPSFGRYGDNRQAISLPRLGITYHAGEDFYHPLTGMRHMDEVIRFAGYEPGDRIGHGLAAGWNLEEFYENRSQGMMMPQGEFFDNLVWLHQRVHNMGRGFEHELHIIEDLIYPLGLKIYRIKSRMHEYYDMIKYRHYIPFDPNDKFLKSNKSILLACLEWYDKECDKERKLRINIPKQFWELEDMCNAVQDHLLEELSEKRIVVEFNPVSNWAVSRLKVHPFYRYLKVQKDNLLVSFNTDDPATFNTRIELEYALMFQDMLENQGMKQPEALRILEQVRRIGIESIFS